MKKVLSLILIVLLFQNIFLYSIAAQEQNPESDGEFLFTREGNFIVIKGLVKGDNRYSLVGDETGVRRELNVSTLHIPAVIDGEHVVLEKEAFRGRNGFRKIVFEQGVTQIPEGLCRDMPNLEEVVILSNVVEIGDYAFKDCKKLETVKLTYATKIGKEAFGWCENLSNIEFIEAEDIEKSAFDGTGVELPVKNEVHLDETTKALRTEESLNDNNEYSDITVLHNNAEIYCDGKPYIRNGRTMVPMRAIFEALGAEVSWDNETRTAAGVKGGLEVKITIGENVLYKNGEAIELDCAAEITNDRTMVPARAISEAFGYIVEWDNETKTVNILDPYKRKYYTYDEKGQVVSISSNLWTSDVVFYSYLYDESGRVIRVWEKPMIKNSDRLFEYTYNEKGQVIAKGTCKDWWMDVLRGAPIDKEVSFTEVEKYFYNDEGQLIYSEYPTGGRRYYIYEEGKLIREENDKGEVVKKYVYDENGRIYYTESY